MKEINKEIINLLTRNIENVSLDQIFENFSKYVPEEKNKYNFKWVRNEDLLKEFEDDKELSQYLSVIKNRNEKLNLLKSSKMSFKNINNLYNVTYEDFLFKNESEIIDLEKEEKIACVIGQCNNDFIVKIKNRPEIYIAWVNTSMGFKIAENLKEAINFFLLQDIAHIFEITRRDYDNLIKNNNIKKPRYYKNFADWLL